MRRALLAACLLGAATAVAHAEAQWSAEVLPGNAWNAPTPLRIEQAGQPGIRTTARYETRGGQRPLYYAVRVARWSGGRAWEGELIHHKLFLRDPPAAVQHFSISHGFNLLLLNRAWRRRRLVLRAGAGPVLAHPENTVRGRALSEERGLLGAGYYLAGPSGQVAAAVRQKLPAGFFATLEAKLTAAWARVPVAGGHADVTNVALHALLGLGGRF